jgi:hypothetical protein
MVAVRFQLHSFQAYRTALVLLAKFPTLRHLPSERNGVAWSCFFLYYVPGVHRPILEDESSVEQDTCEVFDVQLFSFLLCWPIVV